MKNKKMILIVVGLMVLVTAVFAVVHLNTRTTVPEGSLLIQHQGKDSYVQLEKLTMSEVSGSIVNGKGEQIEVRQPGISIRDVLIAAGIDADKIKGVSAFADDEYSAEISSEEINEQSLAYLAKEEDGTVKLIVFGDPNMKRNVRNIVKLIVN